LFGYRLCPAGTRPSSLTIPETILVRAEEEIE